MKKNKIKTRRAALKRFKISGTGKVLRRSMGMRHLLEHKSSKSKRRKGLDIHVTSADIDKVRAMLPGLL